jgi:hypothetical protein
MALHFLLQFKNKVLITVKQINKRVYEDLIKFYLACYYIQEQFETIVEHKN